MPPRQQLVCAGCHRLDLLRPAREEIRGGYWETLEEAHYEEVEKTELVKNAAGEDEPVSSFETVFVEARRKFHPEERTQHEAEIMRSTWREVSVDDADGAHTVWACSGRCQKKIAKAVADAAEALAAHKADADARRAAEVAEREERETKATEGLERRRAEIAAQHEAREARMLAELAALAAVRAEAAREAAAQAEREKVEREERRNRLLTERREELAGRRADKNQQAQAALDAALAAAAQREAKQK